MNVSRRETSYSRLREPKSGMILSHSMSLKFSTVWILSLECFMSLQSLETSSSLQNKLYVTSSLVHSRVLQRMILSQVYSKESFMSQDLHCRFSLDNSEGIVSFHEVFSSFRLHDHFDNDLFFFLIKIWMKTDPLFLYRCTFRIRVQERLLFLQF